VSKKRTTAFGMSRLNATAPCGRKNGTGEGVYNGLVSAGWVAVAAAVGTIFRRPFWWTCVGIIIVLVRMLLPTVY